MSQNIEGALVSGSRLEKVAHERRKKRETQLVPKPSDQAEFPGFTVEREFKNKIRLAREIEPWKLFENRVWLLLRRFGFSELNGSERVFVNARIPAHSEDDNSRVEVDVFGKADENVFVIECKTKDQLGEKDLRDAITRFGHYRSRIENAVRKHYQDQEKNLRVSFVIATQNIQVSDANEKEARGCGIFIWTEKQIEYLEELAKLSRLIGDSARYQLYAIMFRNHEIKSLDITEPAILGRVGKKQYYSFLTEPENLLKIAYVHHRASGFDMESVKEIPVTYQRLLKAKKLQEINSFIEEGYFPNSIIVSFERPPRFDSKTPKDHNTDTRYGILYLPNRYRSAWVIDGQHRLYGYAKSEQRRKTKIPVVAFVGLKTSEQAKLFVEINEKQTPVESNLLWDLYSDIYENSEDVDQIRDLTISNVVKRLNESNLALKGHIYVPSVSKRSARTNITMTTICENIKKNKLVSEKMLGVTRLGQSEKEEFIAERIGAFFSAISSLYPDDWEKGEKGFTRSNNGIAALLLVFRQIIKYFNDREEEQIYHRKNISEFESRLGEILNPIGAYLTADPQRSTELRKNRGSAGQTESAKVLCGEIKNNGFDDFRLPPTQFQPLPKDVKQATPEDVKKQIEDTELFLRKFVYEKLYELHKDNWYDLGVPGDVNDQNSPKGAIEKRLREELTERRFRKEEYDKQLWMRLEFTDLGHLTQIIVARQNWQVFEDTFGSQKSVNKHFSYLIDLRNVFQHFRTIESTVWDYGRAAIKWIRKSLKIWIEESQ